MTKGTGKARKLVKAMPLAVLDCMATCAAVIAAAWGTRELGEVLNGTGFAFSLMMLSAVNVVVFALARMYTTLWEYASVDELLRIVLDEPGISLERAHALLNAFEAARKREQVPKDLFCDLVSQMDIDMKLGNLANDFTGGAFSPIYPMEDEWLYSQEDHITLSDNITYRPMWYEINKNHVTHYS